MANASHELRTPVSVILANAETLTDGAIFDRDAAPRFLEALRRNAQRLVRIVSDLLDLSRLDAAEYPLELGPLQLSEAVNRAQDAVVASALKKSIHLDFAVSPDAWAKADPRAVDQIMLNLLDNAVKYTPNGRSVRVTARSVDDGCSVRIEVQDTGPGVPAQHREHLFERFYRVDPGRSRDMGGTGLGLAIVKTLVEAQRGRVGMEPRSSGGSVFWVELPRAHRPSPEHESTSETGLDEGARVGM